MNSRDDLIPRRPCIRIALVLSAHGRRSARSRSGFGSFLTRSFSFSRWHRVLAMRVAAGDDDFPSTLAPFIVAATRPTCSRASGPLAPRMPVADGPVPGWTAWDWAVSGVEVPEPCLLVGARGGQVMAVAVELQVADGAGGTEQVGLLQIGRAHV